MRQVIHVKTNAPKSSILSRGDIWKVAIAAPPEQNKANVALVKFLSKELQAQVKIISGLTSKKKVIDIS